ncbi:copper amine oxidase N-terminal domain-containing protein [Ezakiella coagulans]|nr:copper amine oxidase N-terminal domain-containing protein [Ezakiella coagulans]UQK60694.1 copper amine oxidase N-terminal domain-containing protein [Ezakiella coagulans]
MLEYLNHLKEIHIRFVAEALGMGVTWDKNTRTVIIEDLLFRVEIPIDTNKIIVNGETYISDVKPEIVDGRTIMPVANIARALGLKDGQDIFWDNATKQVTIIRTISR